MNYGQKIRELRELHGDTQEELARKLGFTRHSYLNQMENGSAIPNMRHAEQIAKIYNVPIGTLYGE